VTACCWPPMSMLKYLGPLLITLYGPLYGGARGPLCPPFLIYTISAARRCAGTSVGAGCGSCRVGMAASARCWSIGLGGVSSGNRGCTGRVRAAPYTISAAEMLLSVLGAVLMFSRTQGRC